jgi:hypothetical protein
LEENDRNPYHDRRNPDPRQRAVLELLGVPEDESWRLAAMLAFGYPRGRWGVATDRRPVHEVSSRNRWGDGFGVQVPKPLWPPDRTGAAINVLRRP